MYEKMEHFLLVFDHSEGKLIALEEFGDDGEAAVAAYGEREQQHQGETQMEIVLIGSDSIETVKFTHANYFDGSVAVSKYLVGL